MPDTIFVYVDVDDTLVRKIRNREVPIRSTIRHVRRLHRDGAILYCWSNGGSDHARTCAQKLGIDALFSGFLQKPHIFIDDERTEEWPCFVHVFPGHLGTLVKYRQRLTNKKAKSLK